MKLARKITAVLAAGAVMLGSAGVLPVQNADVSETMSVSAKNGGTYDVLTYVNYGDYIEITDCDESAVEVEIPAEIEGVPVTSIGNFAFASCVSLTSITIPDGITNISDHAFTWCTSLTSVTIPDNVTSIDDYVFFNCKSLTSILLPENITSIGESAFSGCTDLASIILPDSVTSIGNDAFRDCTSLTSVTIPKGVTSIDGWIFPDCTSLIAIDVMEGNETYSSIDGILFKGSELLRYPAGKTETNYVIPNSVTSIYKGAFMACNNLTSVTIPDSITSISNSAFTRCKNLTSIIIPDSITLIETTAFSECENLTDVYYSGTEEQWNTITINIGNQFLKKATIHFLGTSTPSPEDVLLGDVNMDGTTDASDAADLLIEAAKLGSNQPGDFTPAQKAAADTNKDGEIDASDAALILVYSAASGTSGTKITMEEWLKTYQE